ncbi:GNAT family N-acetyltransferase [Roseiconus lacunae]|nr:GNAT family N-acetyltransferase [Stieleria sp. HD01]
MGMTYFKRYRMEFDLRNLRLGEPVLPADYELLPFASDQLREHAIAKYNSFRFELDADVFPCLARRDGCLKLMRDITNRSDFVPGATWLIRHLEQDPTTGSICKLPVGTIQGLACDGWGSIQNLGVSPEHRSRGLGTILLAKAAAGFAAAGLERMHLEVTTENTGAVRLYERMGFRKSRIVYKAAEVAGARA